MTRWIRRCGDRDSAAEDHTALLRRQPPHAIRALRRTLREDAGWSRFKASGADAGRSRGDPRIRRSACLSCSVSETSRYSSPGSSPTASSRHVVDLDYYVHMGGGAYGSLSQQLRGTPRGQAFGPVFAELADKFNRFVDVLNDVRAAAQSNDDQDVLRLYELWLRTGSKRAERLLRGLGVEPNSNVDTKPRQ